MPGAPQVCWPGAAAVWGKPFSGPRLKFPHWKRPRDHRATPGAQGRAGQARVVRELVAGPGSEPRLLCWPRVTPLGLLRLPAAFPAQSRAGEGQTPAPGAELLLSAAPWWL